MNMINILQKLRNINVIKSDGEINANSSRMLEKFPEILSEIKLSTYFLPDGRKHDFIERLHLIKNQISNIPQCKECGEITSYNKPLHCYNDFCSKKCGYKNPQRYNNISKTIQTKYGVEHAHQSPLIRAKFKNTMLEAYGSEYAMHSAELKDKLRFNNTLKFGGWQHQLVNYSKETIDNLNDREWLIQKHHIEKLSLREISELLENYSSGALSAKFKQFNIVVINHYTSKGENDIKNLLEKNFNIVENNRNIIPPYELDIYIPEKNIAIEYCGLFWHSEIKKENNYHNIKYKLCKEKGIRLITIFEDEWLEKEELIKKKMLHILGLSNDGKIFARKCNIQAIDTRTKIHFFDKHHIQGDGPSSINYGLFYAEHLVAVLGFIKQKNNEYVLNRYATNSNVIGGFTKLLSHFEKIYKPNKIITFADLRWSDGALYEKTGFVLNKILKPDYEYILDHKRYHKFNFRHKYLKTKLQDYGPTLSEHENMLNNGIYRIYDCGKLRFIKEYK